jgi:hypothetical protein
MDILTGSLVSHKEDKSERMAVKAYFKGVINGDGRVIRVDN